MMTIKAGKPLVELTRLCYEADQPLLLVGRHGVGKSVLLAQAAAELGIGYLCRDLSLMEPPDLVGLPRLDGPVTRYCPPDFLPAGGKGLLVFEELNRCQPYMRAPCLQLLTGRALNDYTLPAGWVPMAAINPADQGFEVDDLDPALRSRFVQAVVEPDREEWLAWARDHGVHPGVISYVEADPTIFDSPESNPRAWAGVSRLLRAAAAADASRDCLLAGIVGLVGEARGVAFFRVLNEGGKPLTARDVLAYDPRRRARLREWVAAGRLDLVRGSLMAVQKHLQAARNYALARDDPAAWKALAAFLADLPGDLREEALAFFEQREYDVPPAGEGVKS